MTKNLRERLEKAAEKYVEHVTGELTRYNDLLPMQAFRDGLRQGFLAGAKHERERLESEIQKLKSERVGEWPTAEQQIALIRRLRDQYFDQMEGCPNLAEFDKWERLHGAACEIVAAMEAETQPPELSGEPK